MSNQQPFWFAIFGIFSAQGFSMIFGQSLLVGFILLLVGILGMYLVTKYPSESGIQGGYMRTELSIRQDNIASLRLVLVELENRIDTIRREVEQIPLSYYETTYLNKTIGYKQFKTKYSNKADAQYVALGMSSGLGAGLHPYEWTGRVRRVWWGWSLFC